VKQQNNLFRDNTRAEFIPAAASGPFGQPSRMMSTAHDSPTRPKRWTSTSQVQQAIRLPCNTISGSPNNCRWRQRQFLAVEII